MLTQQQISGASRSNMKKQDKKIPFLINMEDGRLIPNTPGNAKLRNYRPYTGNIHADEGERVRWLGTAAPTMRRMVDTAEEVAEFDVSKATKEELLDFARTELSMLDVSEDTDIRTLRKQIKDRYEALSGRLS